LTHTPRILLFGTGGGSGVTRFLVDSAVAHKRKGQFEAFVVFRRKRNPLGQQYIDDLNAAGINWAEVRAAPKIITIAQLRRHIRRLRPDVLVAHGNSDHFWGRTAAIREGVPVVIMVEQCVERYFWLRRLKMRAMAEKTDCIVAVSAGVRDHLLSLGLPGGKIQVIHNSARLERTSSAATVPLDDREPAVVMVARFARQKDQPTLVRAAGLLRDRGTPVKVRLVGGGGWRHRIKVKWLVSRLGLKDWVEFLGPRGDVPAILARHRVFVLSTHYEGLALAAVEAMAAGCAAIGTRTVGVDEVIASGATGWLVEPGDPESLARGITEALGPEGVLRAAAGQAFVAINLSMEKTIAEYEGLYTELLKGAH